MPFPRDPYCITLLQPTSPQAALFAFDLPVQLNYWRRDELFSRVWGSRPDYRLRTRPPIHLECSGREGRVPTPTPTPLQGEKIYSSRLVGF